MSSSRRAVYDVTGRPLGPVAAETRESMLRALRELLASGVSWRQLTRMAITRRASVSASLFYLYFESVEAAFDVMYDDLIERGKPISKHIQAIALLRAQETGRIWVRPTRTAARKDGAR